ncbi:MAG: hypothetical protein ACTSV6_01355 [Candidatus Heimdallarchaeota archaeon]
MAIIEAGLIVNGLPILRRSYHPSVKDVDPMIKASLMTALKTFAKEAFADRPEVLKLSKFSIMLHDLNTEEPGTIFLYCVLEKKTAEGEVRRRLKQIEEKMAAMNEILDQPVETKGLRKIKRLIDRELKDLCLRASDRAKNIFG